MWQRLIIIMLCYLPANTFAAIIFEFQSNCTDFIRNTDCSYFGLSGSDLVTGGFIVEDQYGAPGQISQLTNDQYQLIFNFGNQSFTEQDATSVLGFNVSLDGTGFSSIVGNFQNASGARLTFLTLTTVNIALDGFEADTFAGGGGWVLAENSDPFTNPVPLPASLWLMMSGIGATGFMIRRNARAA